MTLKTPKFPKRPTYTPSGEEVALYTVSYNRLNGRDGLARREHHLQFQNTGQLHEVGNTEINGIVLYLRDMGLRHAGLLAQRALAQPLALSGAFQHIGYMFGRIHHI